MAFSIRIGNGYIETEHDLWYTERSYWRIEDRHHWELPFRSVFDLVSASNGELWNNNYVTLSNGGLSCLQEGVNYEVFNCGFEALTELHLYKLQEHLRNYLAVPDYLQLPPGVNRETYPLTENYYLAVLFNLEWLMRWALKNCPNPCISVG